MAFVVEPASKKANTSLSKETDRVLLRVFGDFWEFEYDQAYWGGVATLRMKVDESQGANFHQIISPCFSFLPTSPPNPQEIQPGPILYQIFHHYRIPPPFAPETLRNPGWNDSLSDVFVFVSFSLFFPLFARETPVNAGWTEFVFALFVFS